MAFFLRINLVFILLFVGTAHANNMLIRTQSGTDAEYGYTAVGSSSGNTNYDVRCHQDTITDTISHGYFFAENAVAGTTSFYISIRTNNAGVPDESVQCSDEGTLPAVGGITWNEVTFTPSVVLDGTYWICSYVPSATFNYRYDDGGSTKYDVLWSTCTEEPIEVQGSSRNVSLKVTNYDAH